VALREPLRDPTYFSVYGYALMRELITQKFDDNGIRFLYARTFCRRPTSEVTASEQSRCLASVERAVLVYTTSV